MSSTRATIGHVCADCESRARATTALPVPTRTPSGELTAPWTPEFLPTRRRREPLPGASTLRSVTGYVAAFELCGANRPGSPGSEPGRGARTESAPSHSVLLEARSWLLSSKLLKLTSAT